MVSCGPIANRPRRERDVVAVSKSLKGFNPAARHRHHSKGRHAFDVPGPRHRSAPKSVYADCRSTGTTFGVAEMSGFAGASFCTQTGRPAGGPIAGVTGDSGRQPPRGRKKLRRGGMITFRSGAAFPQRRIPPLDRNLPARKASGCSAPPLSLPCAACLKVIPMT